MPQSGVKQGKKETVCFRFLVDALLQSPYHPTQTIPHFSAIWKSKPDFRLHLNHSPALLDKKASLSVAKRERDKIVGVYPTGLVFFCPLGESEVDDQKGQQTVVTNLRSVPLPFRQSERSKHFHSQFRPRPQGLSQFAYVTWSILGFKGTKNGDDWFGLFRLPSFAGVQLQINSPVAVWVLVATFILPKVD